MALITRLTRLLQADLHAVLDRLEEPDILLAQALREMEEAIDADERALRSVLQGREQLRARRATIARRLTEIRTELDVCLASSQEDLARTLLRRRLESERLDRLLAEREQAAGAQAQGLTGRLEAQRRRLEELRAEAESLDPRDTNGWSGPNEDRRASYPPVGDADVEIALLAEKRRRAS